MATTIYVGGPLHGQIANGPAEGYSLQDVSYEFKYCLIRVKAYRYHKYNNKDFMVAVLSVVIARNLVNV